MSFLEYIFQQVFKFFFGSIVFYLIRKALGDKRSFIQIQKETEDFIIMWTGVAFFFIIIILMKIFIK